MDSTNVFKLSSGIIIWIIGFSGGLAPLYIHNIVNPLIISLLSMFSGGIFFSASIIHLLPDAVSNEKLAKLFCNENEEVCERDFAPYFFFGVGFFLVLLLENMAYLLQEDMLTCSPLTCLSSESLPNERSYLLTDSNRLKEFRCSNHIASILSSESSGESEPGIMLAIVIFMSLSFHSCMEGIAIGTQPGSSWDIFIAVIAHKGLSGFALGLELTNQAIDFKRSFISILLFSLMTPFGIFVGWLTMSLDDGESLSSGICTAMAGGTFLFATVMEIIPQELKNRQDECSKNISLCLGFLSFSILALWV